MKYEKSTARSTATALKLARQDTYKVLDELQELGLVERQLNVPAKFTAAPFQDALSILLNRRIKQTADLKTKTKNLITSLNSFNARKVEKEEEPKIFLIPDGEIFSLRVRKAVENTQKSLDIASTSKNLPQGIFSLVGDLKKAMRRGVKIRCITDMPENNNFEQELFRSLENTSFEIRTLSNQLCFRFCIFDGKELSIVLSPKSDFAKSSHLWVDFASIVETYQNHFEMLWLRSDKRRRSDM